MKTISFERTTYDQKKEQSSTKMYPSVIQIIDNNNNYDNNQYNYQYNKDRLN